jgi:hypothetical protein
VYSFIFVVCLCCRDKSNGLIAYFSATPALGRVFAAKLDCQYRRCANINKILCSECYYRHTYHSRFIPEGVAEVSRIFLRDAHVLPKYFAMSSTADVTGGKPIAA